VHFCGPFGCSKGTHAGNIVVGRHGDFALLSRPRNGACVAIGGRDLRPHPQRPSDVVQIVQSRHSCQTLPPMKGDQRTMPSWLTRAHQNASHREARRNPAPQVTIPAVSLICRGPRGQRPGSADRRVPSDVHRTTASIRCHHLVCNQASSRSRWPKEAGHALSGYVHNFQICLNRQQHVGGTRLQEMSWGDDVRED
jgi:hypothetical protein